MNGFVLYEVVDAKERDQFDLTSVKSVIFGAIADVFPEVTDIMVLDGFYCFKSPALSDTERNRRMRCLVRMLARENACAYPESHAQLPLGKTRKK